MEIKRDRYLKKIISFTAVEVVETTRGHVVMIWDSRMKDWSDVYHCPTAEALMNTLLNCKEVFDEECFTHGERDLTDDERTQVAQMRQEISLFRTSSI